MNAQQKIEQVNLPAVIENLEVGVVPATINYDFSVLQSSLDELLEPFQNIVVTEETMKSSRQLATDIRASRKVVSDKIKDAIKKASENVPGFKEEADKLLASFDSTIENIANQMKKAADARIQTCRALLLDQRLTFWQKYGVEVAFQKAEIESLVKLGSLTASDKLKRAAISDVETRVLADLQAQDRAEKRVLLLENFCYKSGLKSALTKEHVAHFLDADDETYNARVQRLIEVELERQKETESKVQEQVTKENVARSAAVIVESTPAASSTVVQESKPEPAANDAELVPVNGKVGVKVTCVFQTEVANAITEPMIDAEIRKQLKKAGISTLSAVYVEKFNLQESA